MKKVILVAVLVLIVIGGGYYLLREEREKGPRAVAAAGTVKGREVNIASKVAGRIKTLNFKEGDRVEAGQVVVELESGDLEAGVRQAAAGVEKAAAEVTVSESAIESARASVASAQADVLSARAEVERAKASLEEAGRDFDRAKALYEKESISKEAYDKAKTALDTARAGLEAAEAGAKAAQARQRAADAQLKTTRSRLIFSKANLAESRATLELNKARLSDTVIASPITGIVVYKALEAGETVSPGVTVLTIVDMSDLYVRTDVEETEVGLFSLGDKALIRVPAANGATIEGKVAEIGRYAEFATQRDVLRGRQDIKTFQVKINFQDPGGVLKPGMTVDVEIPVGQGHG